MKQSCLYAVTRIKDSRTMFQRTEPCTSIKLKYVTLYNFDSIIEPARLTRALCNKNVFDVDLFYLNDKGLGTLVVWYKSVWKATFTLVKCVGVFIWDMKERAFWDDILMH